MSYTKQVVITSDGTGAAVISAIKTQLAAADGWSTADGGTTYTNSTSGVTLSVAFPFTTIQTGGKIELALNDRPVTVFTGLSTLTSATIGFEVSAGPDFFYLCASGGYAGQPGADATYGSPKSFAMLTTISPYFTSDTVADDRICVIACAYTTAATTTVGGPTSTPPGPLNYQVYVKKGLNAGSWVTAELATMRPAVQDIAVDGDLVPNKQSAGNIVYWPFVVIETASGLRGRLNNVFFGGENYLLSGEITAQQHTSAAVLINGVRHVLTLPCYMPNSGNQQIYSPLGTCTNVTTTPGGVTGIWDSLGGPNIIIKKGNGS